MSIGNKPGDNASGMENKKMEVVKIECKCQQLHGAVRVKLIRGTRADLIYDLSGEFSIQFAKPVCTECNEEPMSSDPI